MPAAQEAGFPPNVINCRKTESSEPSNSLDIFLLAIAAPIGRYPLVNALATVVISGLIPQCSVAKTLPVLLH